MNYEDLARGIYTPYFSGENIQYGNYPTPMTPKKSQEDTYSQLASNLYLPFMQGMSGEEIQKMMDFYQQAQPTSTQAETVTPSYSTGYGGTQLGTMPSRGGGGGGVLNTPSFKMISSGVQDIFKKMIGGGKYSGIEGLAGYGDVGAGFGTEVPWGFGVGGGAQGAGLGASFANQSPALGLAALGSMVPAWSGQGMPLYSDLAKALNYIPFVGSILGTGVEIFSRLHSGPPNIPMGELQQNALVGQERANMLNKLLSQQSGATIESKPYGIGVTGRDWMQPLRQVNPDALNYKEYPYIPSTGLPMYLESGGEDPRYTALLKQLEEINASPEMEGMMYTPAYASHYASDPAFGIEPSGYVLGLEYGPNWSALTPETIDKYGWYQPGGFPKWGG